MSFNRTLLASAMTCSMAAVLPSVSYSAASPAAPNILVVIMDDLGTGHLDFALEDINKKELVKRPVTERYQGSFDAMYDAAKRSMPTITELADQGLRMTNAYVATPVCGPSRAGILTGRSPNSFGLYSNDDAMMGIPLDIKLLPAVLQENGYATANIGKYHNAPVTKTLVEERSRTRDYHDNESPKPKDGYWPQQRGFDYSYSYFASGVALSDSPAIFRNYDQVSAPGYITHTLTDEAINFIEQSDKADKPFFINLAYSVPHIPVEDPAPAKYMARFNTGNVESDKFYAHINAADDGVKEIIGKLKALGEYENTLIVFLSDNGSVHEAPMPLNGMDRAFKGQRYRGGLHVPFIAHWKKGIPGGQVNDTMISAIDILPTAMAAAGIDIPESMNLDGKNILPLLQGQKQKPHEYLYWAGPRAYHYDDRNEPFWNGYWKYVTFEQDVPPPNPHTEKKSRGEWAIFDQHWSLHYYDDGKGQFELYNYSQDVSESVNLVDKYPEKFQEMRAAFAEWIKDKPKPVAWGKDRYQYLTTSIRELEFK